VSAAFVPIWTEIDARHGRARAQRFFGLFAGALSAALCVVTVLGVLCAPFLTTLYAAGYRTDDA
jgi:peptidoglycan biosynthesis protein MviN/MurJ (putative lipid II flippase)